MARLFKNLLIPLSLTEPSVAVLHYARRFADQNQGKVTLLHVIPTQSYRLMSDIYRPEESGGANPDHAEKVARANLEKLARDHFAGVDCDVVLRTGSNAAKVILDAEQEFATDLVLLGKSEASELGARLQGGLIEKLIRSSPCPVLGITARVELARPELATDFMAPVDFDRKSITLARMAANFAANLNGKVTLMHVIVANSVAIEMRRELYGQSGDQPINLVSAEQAARARLDEIAAKEFPDVPHESLVVIGTDVASSILDVEQSRKPSVILMATAGYTGFFQFVLGSAAETVARRASCSVITLRIK